MSRKRKIEAVGGHTLPTAVGEHIVSAAVGDVVSRAISAAVGKLEEHQNLEIQVERLDALVTMVRSAVEAAEVMHIRNWWLRRWLWKLRDAACEGADAVRSFRRRAAEEIDRDNSGPGPWCLRTAKNLLFRDGGAAELKSTVARLEEVAAGLGDFLKLLEMEIRTAPLHQQPPPAAVHTGMRVLGAIGFAVGATVIWIAFQVRSKMFRRRGGTC